MKNNTNIYDIDGEIIRRFEDTHTFTALEATKIHEKYTNKIKDLQAKIELTEDEKKRLKIYETYCKNLQHYIYVELQGMNKEQLEEYYRTILPGKPAETTPEDVESALNELKNDVESRENTEDKVQGSTTGDNECDSDEEFANVGALRRESCDLYEKRSVTQDDLLVERDNVNTEMDTYVDFEE